MVRTVKYIMILLISLLGLCTLFYSIALFVIFSKTALSVAKNAYAPYSNFHVGAALLLPDGTVQTGIIIENRSFGATNCAERTALFSAIEKGYKTFIALAVATPDADYPVAPCGICRQVLTEFAPGDTPVIFGNTYENRVETTLEELYTFDSLHELGK